MAESDSVTWRAGWVASRRTCGACLQEGCHEETGYQSSISGCRAWEPASCRRQSPYPKEILTLVDRPLIQYAIDEARAAGITEFIFVTSRGKSALEDYFDNAPELEGEAPKGDGKTDLLKTFCAPPTWRAARSPICGSTSRWALGMRCGAPAG
jgi:hypothetical protein